MLNYFALCVLFPCTFRYHIACDQLYEYKCRSDRPQKWILFPFMLFLHLINIVVAVIASSLTCVAACGCCRGSCCGCCCQATGGKIQLNFSNVDTIGTVK